MNTTPQFHGSDLEQIAKSYNIPQESIVNFGANVNPLGLPSSIKDALFNHWDVFSRYPDRDYTSLRQTIGDYCHVLPDYVMVGNGVTELISLFIQQIAPKKTLILGPTYSEYSRELSFSDSAITYFTLSAKDNFELDVNSFIAEIKKGYDLVILCNPNNPTSSAISTTILAQILTACQKTSACVMIDETYVEFAPDPSVISAVSLTNQFDNLLVLRGVSKFFAAPGIRFGYGITGNLTWHRQIRHHQIPWSLNSIGAFVGELLLKDQDFIAQTTHFIATERARISTALKDIPHLKTFPAMANFFLLQLIHPNLTAKEVFENCIQKGLMIRDCSSFQELPGEFVRFCIMSQEYNERLLAVLRIGDS